MKKLKGKRAKKTRKPIPSGPRIETRFGRAFDTYVLQGDNHTCRIKPTNIAKDIHER